MMGYIPPKKAFSTTPHIVLLHIGTNDITNKSDPSTMASQLDSLVSSLVDAAPSALIVVAKIVPLGYNDANYTSYIGKIPDLVKAHAAKNQNVIMVDMSTLPTSDIRGSGNVHPTDKGYSDMADLWYGAIKGYLPN
jgi:lysophospholipase L1-like esterase